MATLHETVLCMSTVITQATGHISWSLVTQSRADHKTPQQKQKITRFYFTLMDASLMRSILTCTTWNNFLKTIYPKKNVIFFIWSVPVTRCLSNGPPCISICSISTREAVKVAKREASWVNGVGGTFTHDSHAPRLFCACPDSVVTWADQLTEYRLRP